MCTFPGLFDLTVEMAVIHQNKENCSEKHSHRFSEHELFLYNYNYALCTHALHAREKLKLWFGCERLWLDGYCHLSLHAVNIWMNYVTTTSCQLYVKLLNHNLEYVGKRQKHNFSEWKMQTLVIHNRIKFAWHFIKLVYSTWLYLSKTASGMKNTIWHTDVSYISIMCPTFILAGPNLGSLHRGCFCRCENLSACQCF